MGSFRNGNRDEIPSAVCGAHLSPLRNDDNNDVSDGSKRCVAFAPDESYIAWSSGNSIVTIIPWDYFKSTLLSFSSASSPAKSSFKISVDKPDEVRHYFGSKAISIHTTYLVESLTFCYTRYDYGELSSKTFWIRRSVAKNMFLATGHVTGHIRIWDILTGKLLLELLGHNAAVDVLSFYYDARMLLVSAACDGTLKIWDLSEEADLLKSYEAKKYAIFCCGWSPINSLLICLCENRLGYVLDVSNHSRKVKLVGHQDAIIACSFSSDGSFVATASFETIVILWNAYSGHQLRNFCHQHPYPLPFYLWNTWIKCISFSPDGSQIVTVADDGFVRFWDIDNEEDPQCVAAVEDGTFCAHMPTGNILAVGSKDGSLSFWCSSPGSVKPLKFLARNTVRHTYPAEMLNRLPLPNSLVRYLHFEDL